MQPSRLNITLTFVVSILTIYGELTCAYCQGDCALLTNRGLREVPKDLQHNVTILNLSDNNITTIKRHDFSNMAKVKKINLSYNKIHTITDGSFEDARDLEELNLSYNNIYRFPRNIFSRNNNLTKVYLKKNWLHEIGYLPKTAHILESTSLTYLDISFCNVTSISPEAFSGLPNLETLNMSGNSLKELDVEIIKQLKSLKELHIEFYSPSTYEQFCCHLQEQKKKLTLLRPCSCSVKTKESDVMDLNILTTGTIMCACVFLVTTTVYLVVARCKTQKTAEVATEEHGSRTTVQQRPLPQPPDTDDGYEVPATSRYNWFSSAFFRNRQPKRGGGYDALPLENNRNIRDRTVLGNGRASTERIPGSNYGLQETMVYQDSILYPTQSQTDSGPEKNEDKPNLSVPPVTDTYLIPEIPPFPEEYQASSRYRPSTVQGLPAMPFGTYQMTELPSSGRRSEDQKMYFPPVPPRLVRTLQTPAMRNTATVCVTRDKSEAMFVSSAFIELGQQSPLASEMNSTRDDTKQTLTEQKPPPIPPRWSLVNLTS
jgi:hypothetical protein